MLVEDAYLVDAVVDGEREEQHDQSRRQKNGVGRDQGQAGEVVVQNQAGISAKDGTNNDNEVPIVFWTFSPHD